MTKKSKKGSMDHKLWGEDGKADLLQTVGEFTTCNDPSYLNARYNRNLTAASWTRTIAKFKKERELTEKAKSEDVAEIKEPLSFKEGAELFLGVTVECLDDTPQAGDKEKKLVKGEKYFVIGIGGPISQPYSLILEGVENSSWAVNRFALCPEGIEEPIKKATPDMVGKWVKCINNKNYEDCLALNRRYQIHDFNPENRQIRIEDYHFKAWFDADRFALCSEDTEDSVDVNYVHCDDDPTTPPSITITKGCTKCDTEAEYYTIDIEEQLVIMTERAELAEARLAYVMGDDFLMMVEKNTGGVFSCDTFREMVQCMDPRKLEEDND